MWTLIHFHFKDYFFCNFLRCKLLWAEVLLQEHLCSNLHVCRLEEVMMNSCKKDDFDAKSCNFCILFFDPFRPFLLIIYTVNYIIIQTQITHWFILNYSPLVNIEHANMFGSKQCATLTMLCINIDFLHLVKC